MLHGFIFKSFAQNYRRAVAQEPLPNPKDVLRASISKRLCDSSALLKTFPQQEFSKCLTATGALAKPACRRIIYFFSIPLLCENKTKQTIKTVYLSQHLVSFALKNARTCAFNGSSFEAKKVLYFSITLVNGGKVRSERK